MSFDIVPGDAVKVWNRDSLSLRFQPLGRSESRTFSCVICTCDPKDRGPGWEIRNLYDEEYFFGTCLATFDIASIENLTNRIAGANNSYRFENKRIIVVHVTHIKCKADNGIGYASGAVKDDVVKRFEGGPFVFVPDADLYASVSKVLL